MTDWGQVPIGTKVVYYRENRGKSRKMGAVFAGKSGQRIRIIIENAEKPDGIQLISVDADNVEIMRVKEEPK